MAIRKMEDGLYLVGDSYLMDSPSNIFQGLRYFKMLTGRDIISAIEKSQMGKELAKHREAGLYDTYQIVVLDSNCGKIREEEKLDGTDGVLACEVTSDRMGTSESVQCGIFFPFGYIEDKWRNGQDGGYPMSVDDYDYIKAIKSCLPESEQENFINDYCKFRVQMEQDNLRNIQARCAEQVPLFEGKATEAIKAWKDADEKLRQFDPAQITEEIKNNLAGVGQDMSGQEGTK